MTAKEYLNQYLGIKAEIKRLKAQLQELRDLCDQTTVDPSAEKVQSSGSKDRLGDIVSQMADKEAEIQVKIEQAFRKMEEIEETIELLADPDEKLIIQMRYIKGMKWSQIIDEIPWAEDTVFLKHRKALRQLATLCNKIK